MILLKHEKKLYLLDGPVPDEEPPTSNLKDARHAYKKHVDDALEFSCTEMLASTESIYTKNNE